ncbi:hypothetical protein ACFVWS_38835, partial [Streptomyces sp. NPDC058204]|uniref:hypothetical protein n=2 Tax=unclassified Streptomyces TaxID=2593676 RepID=UPI00365425AA
METPLQMQQWQQELDFARSQLSVLQEYIRQCQVRLKLTAHPSSIEFSSAIESLVAINRYRELPMEWPERAPEENNRFKLLLRDEGRCRAAVKNHLDFLADYAQIKSDDRSFKAAHRGKGNFFNIERGEAWLYRARREWARRIVSATKGALDLGAANQISDIARHGAANIDTYLNHMSRGQYRKEEPEDQAIWIGQSALAAAHFGTGLCDEHAHYAMTEANRLLPGTHISVAVVQGQHTWLIIGTPNSPESVNVDAWTESANASDALRYGMVDPHEAEHIFSGVADGRDLRQEAVPYMNQLVPRQPSAPSISMSDAINYVRSLNIPHRIFYISRAATGYNSDSDPDERPTRGHTLSPSAFTANAANGFCIMPLYTTSAPVSQYANMHPSRSERSRPEQNYTDFS